MKKLKSWKLLTYFENGWDQYALDFDRDFEESIPAPVLKEGKNRIVIFETEGNSVKME